MLNVIVRERLAPKKEFAQWNNFPVPAVISNLQISVYVL